MTPTFGEEFSKLIEHLRKAQESAATIGHLDKEQGDEFRGGQWLMVSEMLKRSVAACTALATKRAR